MVDLKTTNPFGRIRKLLRAPDTDVKRNTCHVKKHFARLFFPSRCPSDFSKYFISTRIARNQSLLILHGFFVMPFVTLGTVVLPPSLCNICRFIL